MCFIYILLHIFSICLAQFFASRFWTCFISFFRWQSDQYPGLGLPSRTGPVAPGPFGQGLRDWEVIRRVRATCVEAIAFSPVWIHVVRLLHPPFPFLPAHDIFVHKRTFIDNWIAAEGQPPDAAFHSSALNSSLHWSLDSSLDLSFHSSFHKSSNSCPSGCMLSFPPNCPPLCLLRLLCSCHLASRAFDFELKY